MWRWKSWCTWEDTRSQSTKLSLTWSTVYAQKFHTTCCSEIMYDRETRWDWACSISIFFQEHLISFGLDWLLRYFILMLWHGLIFQIWLAKELQMWTRPQQVHRCGYKVYSWSPPIASSTHDLRGISHQVRVSTCIIFIGRYTEKYWWTFQLHGHHFSYIELKTDNTTNRKVMLGNFNLIIHTLGFSSAHSKVETPPCVAS